MKSSIKLLCAPQNYQTSEAFSSRGRWAVYAGSQAVKEDYLAREDETDMLSRKISNRLTTYFGRYPRIDRTSATPRRKPQILSNKILYIEICASALSSELPR